MKVQALLLILLISAMASCQIPVDTREDNLLPGPGPKATTVYQIVKTPPEPEARPPGEGYPTAIEIQPATPVQVDENLTITILYDNHPYDPRAETAWGYAALVQTDEHNLLFDTGGDGAILLSNMRALGVNPAAIEMVLLSHAHEDHAGGLMSLLSAGLEAEVYLLTSFPESFKQQVGRLAPLIEVGAGTPLGERMYTTGELGRRTAEQSLVVRTQRGLVVITGCAHPGIVEIIEEACETYREPVYLVMGGFHLEGKSEEEIMAIVEEFRRLGVEKVAPSHCTGRLATVKFMDAYGEAYLMAGAGRIITLED